MSLTIIGPNPNSIYSYSIGHILENEFCHLDCWAVLWKIYETTKILLKYATFKGGFFNFLRAKKNKIFKKHFSNHIEKLHKMAFIIFFKKLKK